MPLGGKLANVIIAERRAREIALSGCVPIVPHQIARYLDDNNTRERSLGMSIAQELLLFSDQVNVYGEEETSGMLEELKLAKACQIPINYVIEGKERDAGINITSEDNEGLETQGDILCQNNCEFSQGCS